MNFYTNISKLGSNILVRGYENGVGVNRKVRFTPTLYVSTTEETGYTAFLDKSNVKPREFDDMRDALEFVEYYRDTHGFKIHGTTNFVTQYIQDNYPGKIDHDFSLLNILLFDIEVDISNGKPNIDMADKEITSISMKFFNQDTYYILGVKDYDKHKTQTGISPDNIVYRKFKSEVDMLSEFVYLWTQNYPDIISGWNCIPVNSYIWCNDCIKKIVNLEENNQLFDSTVKKISPKTVKKVYRLENSIHNLEASEEHVFPYICVNDNSYTNLQPNHKQTFRKGEGSVRDMMCHIENGDSIFLELQMNKEDRPDVDISDDVLYLLGLIYTDGSYSEKWGLHVYNTDHGIINHLTDRFVCGEPGKYPARRETCKDEYAIRIHRINHEVFDNLGLIYSDHDKQLNVEGLSRLSKRQFSIFSSGLIDGDGWISGAIGLCDYRGVKDISTLMLWNGVLCSSSDYRIRILNKMCNESFIRSLQLHHSLKRTKIDDIQLGELCTTSAQGKNIKYRIIDDKCYVRISNIIFDREDICMDMETDTNYFRYSGFKTHNCKYFDIMYIVTRIKVLLGEVVAKRLSPWNIIRKKSQVIFNKEQSTYDLVGISVIDYMDAFKKFGYKYGTQESYKLDHIAHTVLGEKKMDYSEYGSLTELYRQNPQLYLDYNLKDTYLIQRLEEETGLISLVLTVAYKGGVNFEDAFGTVGIWESTLYRKLLSSNIIPPLKRHTDNELGNLVGGYVKDPKVGVHSWVVSFDLNSLYPHLMMQYNMSPETYLGKNESVSVDMVLSGDYRNPYQDIAVCANGATFSKKTLGVIPSIIEEYYAERKAIKTEMLEMESRREKLDKDSPEYKSLSMKIVQHFNQQMAIKILMNSLYGAVANKYFIYFIEEMAEAITTSGQLSLRYAHDAVNDYLNKVLRTEDDYIIYCDTDSIYVNLEPLIETVFGDSNIERLKGEVFIDRVSAQKIEPVIAAAYEKLADTMGAYRNAMKMKREKITDRSIFIAKKRYIMNALNSEGVHYAEPKISMTGIEAVRSSTPDICRRRMKELFKIILTQGEEKTQEFIKEFKNEFRKLDVAEVAKISGTNDLEKYLDSATIYKRKASCPIHVRGSILYNHYIKKYNLEDKYDLIQSGDKIKYVYLLLPNGIKENVISFPGDFPTELNLKVDYNTQFEKVFLKPIRDILDCIGWNAEKVSTLMGFFK